MVFSFPPCSVNFKVMVSSPATPTEIISLLASSKGEVKPAKSTLKLPNTGSTKDVPGRIASLVESGLNTAIAISVAAPFPPVTYAKVPSIGSSLSPTVTIEPAVKVIFSEPAVTVADNFKLVSSAFVTATSIPLTLFEAASLISFEAETPALFVTFIVALVSEAETSSIVYWLPPTVTVTVGASLVKSTFSASFNKTILVRSDSEATVNDCPKRTISSPSESACVKLTALIVAEALYNGFEVALVPMLIPITGSLLDDGCFTKTTFPEFSTPVAPPACNFIADVTFDVTSPEKV